MIDAGLGGVGPRLDLVPTAVEGFEMPRLTTTGMTLVLVWFNPVLDRMPTTRGLGPTGSACTSAGASPVVPTGSVVDVIFFFVIGRSSCAA